MKNLLVAVTTLTLSGGVLADTPQQIVDNANQAWNQALNQGKLNELVNLYDAEATVSPGNGTLLKGHDAIRTLFSGFIDNGVHNHQIETVDIIAADTQITQVGYWQAEGVNAEQQAVKFGGVLVTVLEQNEAGEWQLQSHVWNAAP
jgi:ketosteroid isomerase-like protein